MSQPKTEAIERCLTWNTEEQAELTADDCEEARAELAALSSRLSELEGIDTAYDALLPVVQAYENERAALKENNVNATTLLIKKQQIHELRQQIEALQRANEAALKGGKASSLIESWRKRALEMVPPEYADRDLHGKYLRGDNYAAGMDDCADELADALASPAPPVDAAPQGDYCQICGHILEDGGDRKRYVSEVEELKRLLRWALAGLPKWSRCIGCNRDYFSKEHAPDCPYEAARKAVSFVEPASGANGGEG